MSPTFRHPRFGRLLATSAILGLALLVAGCNTTRHEPVITGSVPQDGYRTRHPIVVESGAETYDIPVMPRGTRLTAQMVANIEAFGRDAREQGAGVVTMMVPVGSPDDTAARRVAQEARAALGHAGYPASAVDARTYVIEGPGDAAPIRLAYNRLVARVPHRCARWPDQVVGDNENGDYWNFGCATQANIAAMVDNPADLVSPAPVGRADATRRADVVRAYRKGDKTKSNFALPNTAASKVGSGGSD